MFYRQTLLLFTAEVINKSAPQLKPVIRILPYVRNAARVSIEELGALTSCKRGRGEGGGGRVTAFWAGGKEGGRAALNRGKKRWKQYTRWGGRVGRHCTLIPGCGVGCGGESGEGVGTG